MTCRLSQKNPINPHSKKMKMQISKSGQPLVSRRLKGGRTSPPRDWNQEKKHKKGRDCTEGGPRIVEICPAAKKEVT